MLVRKLDNIQFAHREASMKGFTRRDVLKMSVGTGLAGLAYPLYGCSSSSAEEGLPLRVPYGPTAVTQMGKTVLGYELYIGGVLSRNLAATKVDILADGILVKSYQGEELNQSLIKKVDPFSAEEALFTGRDYDVLFAWPVFAASSAVPSELYHRVYLSNGSVAEGGRTAVSKGTTLIAPPVKGDRWWAGNGPSNLDRHHRSAIIDVSFKCTIAQRFATDWMLLGPDGRLNTGDGTRCTDYYCYGADVLAVADGTVIEARDGIPEGIPPDNYAKTTLQNVFGNSIILDIGGGRYAAYAHLIPGTVTVEIGESVTQGTVLGKLGNSGNSTAPHLHFHICDGSDGLHSEGLPFSFASYELLGSITIEELLDQGKAWVPSGQPQVRSGEMPMLEQVIKLY